MNIKNVLIIFILTTLIAPAQALKLPNEYGDNQCGIMAHDFREKFGGGIVFLQPDTYPSQIGHYLNKVKISGKIYYIDWKHQRIFQNREAVLHWYVDTGLKTGIFTDATFIDTNEIF
ncbi:MAG: hypothetical protein J5U17_04015 [Candidatus Methanoperedens sp.]|nr:hypothetical protein [Candidatus Methanoperedens sp.]MCE8427471.1 hypothetical protein [Candidatus Methanoperedens sp.]